jgi:hypothetical protein
MLKMTPIKPSPLRKPKSILNNVEMDQLNKTAQTAPIAAIPNAAKINAKKFFIFVPPLVIFNLKINQANT